MPPNLSLTPKTGTRAHESRNVRGMCWMFYMARDLDDHSVPRKTVRHRSTMLYVRCQGTECNARVFQLRILPLKLFEGGGGGPC